MKLYSILVVALLAVTPLTAVANCICRCVDGEMQPICSRAIDLQPICPPAICPIMPPSITPIQPLTIPPLGTTNCAPARVLNPYTHQYTWQRLCQ